MRNLRRIGFGFGGLVAILAAILLASPIGVQQAAALSSSPAPDPTATSVPVPTAACSPASGNVLVGGTVSCVFSGTADVRFLFWSAPAFRPPVTSSASVSFTAQRSGGATITAYWSAPGVGSVTRAFSYHIVAPPPSTAVACTPNGGSITLDTNVSCTFSGTGFLFWSAPAFNPPASGRTSATFAPRRSGPASITAYWSAPAQGALTQTVNFTVTAS